MKVYGTGIYENDRADLVGLAYLHFSISQIEDVIEWMKGTDEPAHKEFLNGKLFLMNGL